MVENQDTISFVDLEQQYWQALSIFIDKVNLCHSLPQKISFVLSEIAYAKELYNEILDSLSDDRETYNRIKAGSKHLDSWIMAIETFKKRISLI